MADQIYYSVFTKQGLALLTEAIQNGTKLGITSMAFGDGGGSLPVPNEAFTQLVNEVHRTQLNSLAPDPNNANWLRAEAVIASAIGGFNIRELGLYAGDVLVAYSNYPATYKPNPSDGTARIMTFRMILQIDNTSSFDLVIDPDVVLATIQSVNDAKLEVYQKTVNTVDSLENIDVWNGKIVFLKDVGFYEYSSELERWIPKNTQSRWNTLSQGGSVQDSISYRATVKQFGGNCDGVNDDSDAFQAVIDHVQSIALLLSDKYNSMRTPLTVVINGSVLIKKTIKIRGDLVRFSGENGASIIVDKSGSYTDNYAFNIGGTSSYASYSAHTGAFFQDILFKSSDKLIDLFYAGATAATGGNGGVELKNIINCSFVGFRRIWSHGISAWGWNWLQCQFCLNETLLYCTAAADTGERQTFTGCIWQNGGYAFTFSGGVTPIYWTGGSFDYCAGLINETVAATENLNIFLNSHFEWRANNYDPCIKLLSTGINVIMSGNMALSATSTYYLFSQARSNQIKFNDLMFTGGEGFESLIFLDANYAVDTRAARYPSDAVGRVRSLIKLAQQEVLDLKNAKTFASVVLSNTTNHAATLGTSGLTFSCNSAAAVAGTATIYVPLSTISSIYLARMLISSTSSSNTAMSYFLTDINKDSIYEFSAYSTNSIQAGATDAIAISGVLTDVPAGASYLAIRVNLAGLTSSTTVTLKSIKLFSQ